jgi:hypothetical protein
MFYRGKDPHRSRPIQFSYIGLGSLVPIDPKGRRHLLAARSSIVIPSSAMNSSIGIPLSPRASAAWTVPKALDVFPSDGLIVVGSSDHGLKKRHYMGKLFGLQLVDQLMGLLFIEDLGHEKPTALMIAQCPGRRRLDGWSRMGLM